MQSGQATGEKEARNFPENSVVLAYVKAQPNRRLSIDAHRPPSQSPLTCRSTNSRRQDLRYATSLLLGPPVIFGRVPHSIIFIKLRLSTLMSEDNEVGGYSAIALSVRRAL